MDLKVTAENYCAIVVKIEKVYPLKNCDNVVGTKILGNQIIVSNQTSVGLIGLYFPTGSKLSEDYIKNNNLFRDSQLNLDGEKKGFFEKNCRVKAVLFRKHESNGFFMPLTSLSYLGVDLSKFKVGDQFNEIDGVEISTKYLPTEKRASNAVSSLEKMGIVENQFQLHGNTQEFANRLDYIELDSVISVTVKIHGTSAVFGKVLGYNRLSIWQKIKQFFGEKYPKLKYMPVAASRSTIKNPLKKLNGFDLWCDNANKLLGDITDGTLVYGEIVGHFPDGKFIQKNYDYKLAKDKYDFYAYKIVKVDQEGKKNILSWEEMAELLSDTNIKTVPLRFYGKAIDLAREFGCEPNTDEELQECLMQNLKKEIEILEPLCKLKVPREGYVIRIENSSLRPAFKLKSFLFKKMEDENLDNGIIDIETELASVKSN